MFAICRRYFPTRLTVYHGDRCQMAGLDHGPAHAGEREQENQQTIARNAQLRIILFLVYLLFYGGFVLLTAFNAKCSVASSGAVCGYPGHRLRLRV